MHTIPLKAILIDDEKNCTEILRYDLSKVAPDIEIVQECNDSKEGLKSILTHKPDIVFLDIEMPWMNGFELLDALPSIDFAVVFVTAFDQYAIKAFRYYALDYILKPVDQDLLRSAIERIRRSRRKLSKTEIAEVHDSIRNGNTTLNKLVLPVSDGYEFIELSNIIRCEAYANYAFVHLSNGQKIIISKPLKYLASMLDVSKFFRPHQSHLVNLDHVTKYSRQDGGSILMSDKSEIPISRNRKEEFQNLIFNK